MQNDGLSEGVGCCQSRACDRAVAGRALILAIAGGMTGGGTTIAAGSTAGAKETIAVSFSSLLYTITDTVGANVTVLNHRHDRLCLRLVVKSEKKRRFLIVILTHAVDSEKKRAPMLSRNDRVNWWSNSQRLD